jgi:Fe-S oxidoreductase
MDKEKYYFFNKDACDLCGLCLNKCPVLELPIEEAKEEMKRLIEGEETKLLAECTSCMACNLFCPKDCFPYELILYRWYERYKKKGLSAVSKIMVTPMQTSPNVWSLMLSEEEKKTFQSWSKPRKAEEILYPGCMMCFPPYLSYSKLFDDFNIVMSNELCCGEPFYRIGVLDTAEQAAKRLEKQFKIMGVKKVIFPCLGCCNTIKNIYPERFGVEYEFESIPLLDIVWKKIEGGELKIKNKLNIRVTVLDNCHSRGFGTHIFDLIRKILKTLGAEIVEMKHNRENAPCCGIAAFAIDQNPIDVINVAVKTFNEAEETGADALVVNCGGCLVIQSVGRIVSGGEMPIYHIIEMVQKAIGEEPLHRNMERAYNMFKILTQETPKIVAELPERYQVEPIKPDIEKKDEK